MWIDGEEPTEEERDHVLGQLELSPVVVDALMDPRPQRTKLIRYGECFHVAVHDCEFVDNDFKSREVDLVVGPGWVLTVRHPTEHSSPVPIDEIMRRFELQFGGKGKPEEGFLLWAVFDVLIDRYFETTEAIDDRLDDIEEQVFGSDGQAGVPAGVFALRRDLAEFRRAVAPMREVVDAISRKEVAFVCDEAIIFFRDIFDRTLRALDYIESERDLLTEPARSRPGGDLEPHERRDEEGHVVGRHPPGRDVDRRHLRHELPPHARAQLGVRLPARARRHAGRDGRALHRVQEEDWL